jgi:hypothetical protein
MRAPLLVGDNASDNIVVGPVSGSNLFLGFDADGVVDQIVPLPMFDNIAVATGGGDDHLRFGRASATLAAGQTRTLTLRAVHKAHGRITRPVVTVPNVDTGSALSVKPHLP